MGLVSSWNEHIATELLIGSDTYVVVNPDGRWVGSGHTTGPVRGGGDHSMAVLRGEGAYDGWTAALLFEREPMTFEGVIFPGEVPAVPEPVEPYTD